MKLLLIIGMCLIIFVAAIKTLPQLFPDGKNSSDKPQGKADAEKNEGIVKGDFTKSIFVPSWTLVSYEDSGEYDHIYYFGVSVANGGLDTEDAGYRGIDTFLNNTQKGTETFLTIILTDTRQNSELLADTQLQKTVIAQSLELASRKGFDGILLDLETSALDFGQTKQLITKFNTAFAEQAGEKGLDFQTAIFGDVYYRGRPYDIKALGDVSNALVVMTYDFHKSRGNPGPTFPLDAREKYPYSFNELISDLQKDVSLGKVIFALGRFGYDWEVDNEGNTLSNGEAVTQNQFISRFVDNCRYDNCLEVAENKSDGHYATYIHENKKHEVWVESEGSILEKEKHVLDSYGMGVAYWAHSFF